MKKTDCLPLPARGRGRIKCRAVFVISFLGFLLLYKFTVRHFFSGPGSFYKDVATSYGGISTGELAEFIQSGRETCGHAVLAFFLTGIGIPKSEENFIEFFGTDSMLSLSDLEAVFISHGFQTQLLKIDPGYFKANPQVSILHFSTRHFVVFLGEENGEPVIFDPAYGKVHVSWTALSRLLSGYMLYIYNG
jgi:hypothetical protein